VSRGVKTIGGLSCIPWGKNHRVSHLQLGVKTTRGALRPPPRGVKNIWQDRYAHGVKTIGLILRCPSHGVKIIRHTGTASRGVKTIRGGLSCHSRGVKTIGGY
jgi:hypothetical protein